MRKGSQTLRLQLPASGEGEMRNRSGVGLPHLQTFTIALFGLSLATGMAVGAPRGGYPFMTVHDDKLYTQVSPGHYVAIDLRTLNVSWTFTDRSLGGFTKPVFSGESLILAAEAGAGSEVISLRGGKPTWRTKSSPLVRASSPALCGEHLLIGDSLRGDVSALDVSTGRMIWRRGGEEDHFFHPPAVSTDSAFYVVRGGSEVATITEVNCLSGDTLSQSELSGDWGSNSPIFVYNHQAILFSSGTHQGTDIISVALPSNTIAWHLHTDDSLRDSPVVAGGLLVVVEGDLLVVALDSGQVKFQEKQTYRSLPGVLVGDQLVRQSGERQISAIDLRSHLTLWNSTLPGGIVSNIVSNRGSLYVQIQTRKLLEVSASTGRVLHVIPLR